MPRKVLVVSTVENAVDAIRDELGPDVEAVEVVVPVVRQGVLDWLANDERAFRAAREAAERQAGELPVEVVDARPGEADVELAIRDALATFPADEVIVVTRCEDDAGPIERAADTDLPAEVDGARVRRIVVVGR